MKDVRLADVTILTLGCARLKGVDMSGFEKTTGYRDGDEEHKVEWVERLLQHRDSPTLNGNASSIGFTTGNRPWCMPDWLGARPYAPDDEFDERHVDDGPIATWTVPTDGHVDDAD